MNLGIENEYQEFKESLSQLDKGLKSLTAMLNRHKRGSVFFGVKDNGDVIGLTIGKNTLMDIRLKASELIKPKVIINIEQLEDEKHRQYIKISSTGSDIPYSFDGRFYNRSVASDEQVDTNILRKMLTSGNNDLITEIKSKRQDLTFKQMNSFLSGKGMHVKDDEAFYRSLSLYNDDGYFNLMALLLSDQNDVSIKVVEFDGSDKTTMSKRTEYGFQSLLVATDNIQKYFKSINVTKVELADGYRKETPLFSYDAFHEALVNAMVHNEWRSMVPPSVFVYTDRIEIVSYGSLPYELSKEEFFKGVSCPVNNKLLGIFIDGEFAEQSGHGIPKITENCGKDCFDIESNTLTVTIRFNYESDMEKIQKVKAASYELLSESQRKVAEYLKENPNSTLSEVSEKTSLSLSGVKKIVAKLQELAIIERVGSKKDGYWK